MSRIQTFLAVMISVIMLSATPVSNNDSKKLIKEAEYHFANEEYDMAEPLFRRLVKLYPKKREYHHGLGVCLLNMRNRERESLEYLEKSMGKNYTESFFYGAMSYHYNIRLEQAIDCLDIYQSKKKRQKTNIEIEQLRDKILYAKQLMSNPISEKPKKMSTAINTKFQDYAPLINNEGTILYFTSRRTGSTGGLTDYNGIHYEDVYSSYKVGDKWSKAKSLPTPVNTSGHDANVSFASNGETMILYRTEEDENSGTLLYSIHTENGWSDPVEYDDKINGKGTHEPSACLSFDESFMILVSDREGGYGGTDLYILRKLPTGDWSRPKNMGPLVNSAFNEDSPFLSSDSERLYFSSQGHNSIGGYDIFYSEIDENETWQKPVNIGFPINTVSDDIYFTSVQNGTKGYFSSSRSGNMDIYETDMLFEDNDLCVVKGFVKDANTDKKISAYVALEEVEDLDNLSATFTNNFSGKYLLVVKPNKTYNLVVEAPGYQNYTEEIIPEVDNKGDFVVISKDIRLLEIH